MANKLLTLMLASLVMGLAFSAGNGTFGEYASLNACHCEIFNATTATNTWTLYSTFNIPISFYIVKPNITGISISTSVSNGVINPNSIYPITITISGHRNINTHITAYANTSQNSTGGATIRLATTKLIRIEAINSSQTNTTLTLNVTSTSTIQPSQGIQGSSGGITPTSSSSIPTISNVIASSTTSTSTTSTTTMPATSLSTIPAMTTLATTTMASNAMAANALASPSGGQGELLLAIFGLIVAILVIIIIYSMYKKSKAPGDGQGEIKGL